MNPALESRITEFEQKYFTTYDNVGPLPQEVGRATLTVLLHDLGYEKTGEKTVARFRDGGKQDVFATVDILNGNIPGYSYIQTSGPENLSRFTTEYERSFFPAADKGIYAFLGGMLGLVAGGFVDAGIVDELRRTGEEWFSAIPPLLSAGSFGLIGYTLGRRGAIDKEAKFANEFRTKWGAVNGKEAIVRALRS